MQSDFERVFAFRVSVSNNQRQFDSDDPEVQPIALSGQNYRESPRQCQLGPFCLFMCSSASQRHNWCPYYHLKGSSWVISPNDRPAILVTKSSIAYRFSFKNE